MRIKDITDYLESIAPLHLQESYDNAGLMTGDSEEEVKGILVCLDSTPEVVDEAIEKGCNLIIAHHPIIFSGLKQLTGADYIQRTVIKAIRANVAIYAIHTNLDNVLSRGVNGRIAERLGLQDIRPLAPLKYSDNPDLGAGVIGTLDEAMPEADFLAYLKKTMKVEVVRHTALLDAEVKTVAICGGSGSFLLGEAIAGRADVFVTGDFKYHQFFDANGKIVIADIGHFESEQFTVDLICDLITEKFPNFAPNSSERAVNPVRYYTG